MGKHKKAAKRLRKQRRELLESAKRRLAECSRQQEAMAPAFGLSWAEWDAARKELVWVIDQMTEDKS
ncbi:hypothetical protein LCGC14_1204660 [marine sediment metagenome]|uniref:Uncharacterized protein n=1 Tax=marine sediment metagenome TaxID=412755 RepID=A0A0F9M3A4_9ZZZZ